MITAHSIYKVEDKLYSLESMFKLCVWLEKPVDYFFRDKSKEAIKSIQKATINQMDFD